MLPLADTMVQLNWKVRMPPGHFRLLRPLNQLEKKKKVTLGEVRKLELLYNADKKDYEAKRVARRCLRVKVWITPAEFLAEDGGNVDWVAEEGRWRYH